MSTFQQKSQSAWKEKYGSSKGKKNEDAQILDLLDRDFNSVVLSMPKVLMEITSKELKEARKILCEQNENINKEIEIIKRN